MEKRMLYEGMRLIHKTTGYTFVVGKYDPSYGTYDVLFESGALLYKTTYNDILMYYVVDGSVDEEELENLVESELEK
jgi:hypothetical protein